MDTFFQTAGKPKKERAKNGAYPPLNRSAGLGPALGFRPAVRLNCLIDFALRCFASR